MQTLFKNNWKYAATVCMTVLAVAYFSPDQANSADKPSGTFPYSYAYHTCAPWDGAAVSVHLLSAPYKTPAKGQLPKEQFPAYFLSIWTDNAKWQSHQWLNLEGGSSSEMNGVVSYCPKKNGCMSKNGKARILKMTQDRVEGELKVSEETPGSKEKTFSFKAPVFSYQFLCGG